MADRPTHRFGRRLNLTDPVWGAYDNLGTRHYMAIKLYRQTTIMVDTKLRKAGLTARTPPLKVLLGYEIAQ